MLKEEMIRLIPAAETVYILYSTYTKCPYTVCNPETYDDEAYVFFEEEPAVAMVKALSEEKNNTAAVRIEKENILRAFSSFRLYGINALVIKKGEDEFRFQVSEIVKAPDYSRLPENQRALENPGLQLTMMYFAQEFRKRQEKPDISALKAMEEEMLVNVIRSSYLLPFRETESDGKKHIQMLMIKMSNERHMIPLFSDAMELERFKGKENLKISLIRFDKLVELPLPEEAAGYIINPAGTGIPLTGEWLSKVKINVTKQE